MDYKEITLESYNKHAKYFSEYFKGLFDLEKRKEFHKYLELLKGRKKILDLGCGGGDHAAWFKEQGLEVNCIDFSEEMIKICKEKGLNARVMDIEDLKFKDNEFDGIWAVTSLLHIHKNKLDKVAKKLSSILVNEGILYVVVKEGGGERLIVDKKTDHLTKRFFSFWKEDELGKIFEKYFEVIEFSKMKVGETTYLHFFFKNKKLS